MVKVVFLMKLLLHVGHLTTQILLYFLHILPFIGGLISGNRNAYRYLPESVLRFPKPDKVCAMLAEAGFRDVEAKAFTFGLCRMFTGVKR